MPTEISDCKALQCS